MDTWSWQYCRTCLSIENLNPIFPLANHSEKYSSVIFATSGIQVEPNDQLPQEMCSSCINFINESYKFRKTCEETQKVLNERLINKPLYELKVESIKSEAKASVDIADLLVEEDFKDEEDDLPLTKYGNVRPIEFPAIDEHSPRKESKKKKNKQYATTIVNENDYQNDFNCEVVQISQNPDNIVREAKEARIKPVKRKPRMRKSEKDIMEKNALEKKERVREEIECEYCHKILTSKLSLRNHYKIHTGFDVVCEHCGKKFITRRLLLMHCRAKHGYEKVDKCSFCDYRASNAEQVKIHERLHTGEKPYTCPDCGAGFHRRSCYLQHVAIHLPEKTVQCELCPARFKSVTLMQIHKNRHRASPYVFKCGVCDNSFARRRNVARHLLRAHGLPPTHITRDKKA